MCDVPMRNEDRLRLFLLQSQLTQQMTYNALLQEQRKKKKEEEQKTAKKIRTVWVRRWLKRRPELGQDRKLLMELRKEDKKGFRNFLEIDYDTYRVILHRIVPRIKKFGCNYRYPLSPGLKLAITLRYMAAGDNYTRCMVVVSHTTQYPS